MTKKEIVEKFKKEMPEFTGKDEEIEIKKSLYIYIELAKMKSFDERFFFGNILSLCRTMSESKKERKDLDKVADKRKLICVTLSYLYKGILNDFGIKCEIHKDNPDDEHRNNIITLKNGRRILADVQLELYRIQTKMTLTHFHSLGENFITAEDLTNMLIDIGYIKDEEDYRDCIIRKVKKELEGEDAIKALNEVVKNKEICEGLKGLEASEAFKYYYVAIKNILGRKRMGGYYQFACNLRKNNKPTNKYTFCVYLDTNNWSTIKPYFYSEKEGKLIPCDLENIEELEKQGLHLGLYSGARKLKKYVRDKKRFMERSKKEKRQEETEER